MDSSRSAKLLELLKERVSCLGPKLLITGDLSYLAYEEAALRELTDALNIPPIFECVPPTEHSEGGLLFSHSDGTTFVTDITVDSWLPFSAQKSPNEWRRLKYESALKSEGIEPLESGEDGFLRFLDREKEQAALAVINNIEQRVRQVEDLQDQNRIDLDKLRTLLGHNQTGCSEVANSNLQADANCPVVILNDRRLIRQRVVVTLDPPQVTLNGTAHAVKPDGALLVKELIDAQGDWKSSKEIGIGRAHRARSGLPKQIRELIESATFKGYRIPLSALAYRRQISSVDTP